MVVKINFKLLNDKNPEVENRYSEMYNVNLSSVFIVKSNDFQ